MVWTTMKTAWFRVIDESRWESKTGHSASTTPRHWVMDSGTGLQNLPWRLLSEEEPGAKEVMGWEGVFPLLLLTQDLQVPTRDKNESSRGPFWEAQRTALPRSRQTPQTPRQPPAPKHSSSTRAPSIARTASDGPTTLGIHLQRLERTQFILTRSKAAFQPSGVTPVSRS